MKNLCLSVSNDVYTDQRVNKMAITLNRMGFNISITGVLRKDSPSFSPEYASVKRLPLFFHKKFLFYAELNIRLFFSLLFKRADIFVSNDLDTLLPNYLVSRIRRKPLVFDAHEYFTGTPEVTSRPFVYRVWKSLEGWLLPKQKHIITVNESLAALYEGEYGIRPAVVRNLPLYSPPAGDRGEIPGLTGNTPIILLQGTGINIDRGAEELVMSMRPEYGIENAVLLIIGSGDVLPVLKKMVQNEDLGERVIFMNKMPPDRLRAYTRCASIGVSLDKDTSINYRYSLPNKIFDYMMAGVPQLVSDLPEPVRVIEKYNTGLILPDHNPGEIARSIRQMLSDTRSWELWHKNSLEAARELCWEKEEQTVKDLYAGIL